MQLDGTGGFIDAFIQMCAYTKGGQLHLFKGMPEKWEEVEISNLRLPGQGSLSASKQGKFDLRKGEVNWQLFR